MIVTHKLLGSLALLALALLTPMPAQAGYISAVNFTGGTISATGANVSAGYSFKTNQAVTIDALADFSPLANGSNVRLYNSQGTVLASTTVFSTDPTDTSGTFHFHSIASVTLAASTTYYIAADVIIGQLGEYSVTGLTTNPAINFGLGVESLGLGNNPTSDIQGVLSIPAISGRHLKSRPRRSQNPPPSLCLASALPAWSATAGDGD